MQEIDWSSIDLQQHILGHQLIQIVAGGISLHRKTPGQVASGEDLAQVIRIKKIGLILQKSQQFRFTHDIPLFTLQRLMMREIHQALALNSLLRFEHKNGAQIRGRRITKPLQPRQGLPHS